MSVFFIVSAPRSASTAIATICNTAENCICRGEPDVASKTISRDMMDGKQVNIRKWLKGVRKRVKRGLKHAEIYGEKDVTYGPMIPFLYQEFGCKFVYLVRNKDDVVKSLIRWNDEMWHNIYQGEVDLADYSRPRPAKPVPLWWHAMSLEQKCGYYWDRLTEIYDATLTLIPPTHWIVIDVSDARDLLNQILDMKDFLGLTGLPMGKVAALMGQRINSIEWRKKHDV
jgi:hypothetical protein